MSEEQEATENPVIATSAIKPGDVGWTSHVMALLNDDEKYDKYPLANGLRRLTELLIGDIVGVTSQVVEAPTAMNGHRATVTVELHIENGNRTFVYAGSADAWTENCSPPYDKFPVAMAESRAEGRALRRALKVNVATAEEMREFGSVPSTNDKPGADIVFSDDTKEDSGPKPMTSGQVKAIDTVASRADIDVNKVLEKKEYRIETLTFEQAKDILKELQVLQSKVDEAFKGFNPNWSTIIKGE